MIKFVQKIRTQSASKMETKEDNAKEVYFEDVALTTEFHLPLFIRLFYFLFRFPSLRST